MHARPQSARARVSVMLDSLLLVAAEGVPLRAQGDGHGARGGCDSSCPCSLLRRVLMAQQTASPTLRVEIPESVGSNQSKVIFYNLKFSLSVFSEMFPCTSYNWTGSFRIDDTC